MNSKDQVVALVELPSEKDERKLKNELTAMEVFAMQIEVKNDDDYSKVVEFGRMVKEKSAQVKDFFAPMKKTAHDAHKAVCDKEKDMLKPLVNVEKILKDQLGAYVLRKEQEKARQEEEARRLALEEAKRLEAEIAEAEKLGDIDRANEAAIEASVVKGYAESLVVESSVPKNSNASFSKDWEIESIDASSVPVEIAGVVIRPVDEAAVLRLIRATKGQVQIEGIKYKETMKVSIRR